jgi:hypothetical protein
MIVKALEMSHYILALAVAVVYHVIFKMSIRSSDNALALCIWALALNPLWLLLALHSECWWLVFIQCNAIFVPPSSEPINGDRNGARVADRV